ncbi:hypothetical protein J6590_086277 [Homalodisca vitripennis]|nr:hypothetical protein J6590_086277 [Homalodisca vitripennis]
MNVTKNNCEGLIITLSNVDRLIGKIPQQQLTHWPETSTADLGSKPLSINLIEKADLNHYNISRFLTSNQLKKTRGILQ